MTEIHASGQNVDEVFVELIGPDGLTHHVGPFKTHALAEAWIELNSTGKDLPQNKPDQKITVARGGCALLRPAD
jgi:hypothetical protein